MPFLSYTIFADAACTEVRHVVNLYGDRATHMLRAFQDLNRGFVVVGQVICGCRIDRMASEDISEAA